MNLDALHHWTRQLAKGAIPPPVSGAKPEQLSAAEHAALRHLHRRARAAGALAALAPVPGTPIWMGPPRTRATE